MPFYSFHKDKAEGNYAEVYILEALHKIGFSDAYQTEGKFSDYDIIIPSKNITFEIKNDMMALKTGNIAIEIEKKDGTPTGITVSKADYWIIFAQNEIYFLDRLALKDYALKSDFRTVFGGDKWFFKMVLVPIQELKKQSFFIQLGK